MTPEQVSSLRLEALRLANIALPNTNHDEVIKCAKAYFAFLADQHLPVKKMKR